MARLAVFSVLSLLLNAALAHNVLAHFLVNDTETAAFQYVRNITPPADFKEGSNSYQFGQSWPLSGIDHITKPQFVCGRNAEKSAARTETAIVIAGEEVGFRLLEIKDLTPTLWIHAGPGHIYMANVPDGQTLEKWDGKDANWFKIKNAYGTSDSEWYLSSRTTDFNFTIPKTTPPGNYLIRAEHMGEISSPQWYVGCAHVKVLGQGGGRPEPTIKLPYSEELIRKVENDFRNHWSYPKSYPGFGSNVWSG